MSSTAKFDSNKSQQQFNVKNYAFTKTTALEISLIVSIVQFLLKEYQNFRPF